MRNYQVTGFPTLLVLDSEGKKLIQLPVSFEALPILTTLEKGVKARH